MASLSRQDIAMVLKVATELRRKRTIDGAEQGVLKELLLDHDRRLEAAIQLYDLTEDRDDFANTLCRLAKSNIPFDK